MAYDFEKEKREAMEAGNRALHSLREAQTNLDSARNWGLWDMFGGGTITSLIKSSWIVQSRIWSRQNTIFGHSVKN